MPAEVQQQQRVVKSRVFLSALDRVRQAIDEEQPVWQCGELVGDRLGVSAHQAQGRSAAVTYH